jgi:hypothetical protein
MARLHNPDIAAVPQLPNSGGHPWNSRPTTQEVFGKTPPPPAAQEFLEREFLERVVLPNGTFKTTTANRLDDLNLAVLPWVARISDRPIQIMDVGVSSGVSTLEWHNFLGENGIPLDMVGTDLTIYTSLVNLTSRLAVLVDRDRNILHVDVFGHGAPARADGLLGIVTGMIRLLFRAAMSVDRRLPPLQGRVRETAQGRLLHCEPVTLLTRRLLQRASLRIFEEDLLAPERPEFKQAFHVVRAGNILNRAYFSDQVLVQIIAKLKERLRPNGLLIVCRTTRDGVNHATLFECGAKSRLRVLLRLGSGSEIEELLTAV